MKRYSQFLIIIFLLASNFAFSQATIELRVSNVEINKGPILVALYNSESSYMEVEFKAGMGESTANEVVIMFEDIPGGEYALTLFQDENEDKELNVGMFGPKEPYAFSNNAKGTFGPAKYKDAKFKVANEGVTVHKITL